jgi:Fe-S oxidoreductase
LTEFLAKKAPEYVPPRLERKAIVQEHCHQKAILDTSGERKLFDAMGLRYELPDSGCCGMAGPFGFDAAHLEVSLAVGERVLLPKVREADDTTIIVANGFSCREQIAQTTNRQALHPAQVLKMAIDDSGKPSNGAFPELRYMSSIDAESKAAALRGATALLILAAGFAGFLIWRVRKT